MKALRTFNKKGCPKVELISDTFGVSVKVTDAGEVLNCYLYDSIHEAFDMFWYCVAMSARIDKYIK